MNNRQIYTSLDDARDILQVRWNDKDLRTRIELSLGELMWTDFKIEPRSVLWRFLLSPDNGFTFFFQRAQYIRAKPLVFEYLDDLFVSLNDEKKGLGRLRIMLDISKRGTIDIVDFSMNEKKKLGDVIIKSGESLVDFHRSLLSSARYPVLLKDISSWCHAQGRPIDYYYPFLCHFIAHGVLFESYITDKEDQREYAFTQSVVLPTLERIYGDFGLQPLIVKLYPDKQTTQEDFYWWSYPPEINDILIEYSKKHHISFVPSKYEG